jgi:hypothetical protein
MTERLPAHVEAAAIMRAVQADGGFAAVLRKGDPDRGALILLLYERGTFLGLLERTLGADFEYRWTLREANEGLSSERIAELIASRRRFDEDSWLIELDIPRAERFIAETTRSG